MPVSLQLFGAPTIDLGDGAPPIALPFERRSQLVVPLALKRVVEAGGGEVITGAEVREIKIEGGRATGVKLADGRFIGGAKFVASAIDFPTTLQMTGEELFPEPVREKAKAWHWGNHSLVTLHLALKNPPRYRAEAFDPDIARAYNIFFGMDDIDEVASCFEDCAAKKFPKVLMGNGACNSVFDPSYAPAGRHVAFWWPFAPYSVDGSPQEWEKIIDSAGAPCASIWRIEEVIDHPQIVARGAMQTIETPYGPLRFIGNGFRLAHGNGKLERMAPPLGTHTDEVLAEAGYSADEIKALHKAQAV